MQTLSLLSAGRLGFCLVCCEVVLPTDWHIQFAESWIYAFYLRGIFQCSLKWRICNGAIQMRTWTDHVLNFKHTRSPLGSKYPLASELTMWEGWRVKNDAAMQASDACQGLLPAFSYLCLLCILQKKSLKKFHFGVILKKSSSLNFKFCGFLTLRISVSSEIFCLAEQ